MESVIAPRIFVFIWVAVSVRRIREDKSGEDLDIFEEGSLRERMRREGAGNRVNVWEIRKCFFFTKAYCLIVKVSGRSVSLGRKYD